MLMQSSRLLLWTYEMTVKDTLHVRGSRNVPSSCSCLWKFVVLFVAAVFLPGMGQVSLKHLLHAYS